MSAGAAGASALQTLRKALLCVGSRGLGRGGLAGAFKTRRASWRVAGGRVVVPGRGAPQEKQWGGARGRVGWGAGWGGAKSGAGGRAPGGWVWDAGGGEGKRVPGGPEVPESGKEGPLPQTVGGGRTARRDSRWMSLGVCEC